MKPNFGAIVLVGLALPLWAQQAPAPAAAGQPPAAPPAAQAAPPPQPAGVDNIRPTYILGPGDQISISAFEVDEISDKPYRIDSHGDVTLPLLDKIHVDGLTVEQFEAVLVDRLKTIVRQPQVVVKVIQYRSDFVFFEGMFRQTGIVPLQGRRNLIEMLAVVGTQPNAAHRIKVTRRLEIGKIPLPNAVEDPDRKVSTVEISLGSLRDNVNPAEDIVLMPYDTISLERAEMIYVNGEVARVGGIELGERESISAAQLITMVGGLGKDADASKAKVLRPILNTSKRADIPINLKKIMAGTETDFPLLPNDMLVVPRNSKRSIARNAAIIGAPTALSLIITFLVYR